VPRGGGCPDTLPNSAANGQGRLCGPAKLAPIARPCIPAFATISPTGSFFAQPLEHIRSSSDQVSLRRHFTTAATKEYGTQLPPFDGEWFQRARAGARTRKQADTRTPRPAPVPGPIQAADPPPPFCWMHSAADATDREAPAELQTTRSLFKDCF